MASYRPSQRPSTSADSRAEHGEWRNSTAEELNNRRQLEIRLVCPFNIPSSAEAAAARIIRNLDHFASYYTYFVWTILFISLIPRRKVSLIPLVFMTSVASVYLLLLRALPNSYMMNKVIDRRLILSLIVIITMVELVVTRAGLHLLASLAASTPIVLLHAALWMTTDASVDVETGGDVTFTEIYSLAKESTPSL